MSATFLILSAITLIGACAAMILRGLVHCALAVAIAFAGLGTLYLNLGAQFLGLAQLLVYVGAIAVLIVFVILLTRGGESDATPLRQVALPLTGLAVAGCLFAVPLATPATVRELGAVLMDGYVLPLEVIGLMLTAALIGAVIIAMKEKQDAP
jgi:NADH-quinone oxidoreductase subunit J